MSAPVPECDQEEIKQLIGIKKYYIITRSHELEIIKDALYLAHYYHINVLFELQPETHLP